MNVLVLQIATVPVLYLALQIRIHRVAEDALRRPGSHQKVPAVGCRWITLWLKLKQSSSRTDLFLFP